MGRGGERLGSCYDVREQLIIDEGDSIAQRELALLQALKLQQIAAHGAERLDGRIEIAMLLSQPVEFGAQLGLVRFLRVGHLVLLHPSRFVIADGVWKRRRPPARTGPRLVRKVT